MLMDELRAWLTLVRAPGVHGGVLTELLSRCSGAAAILAASDASLCNLGMEQRLIDGLRSVDSMSVDHDLHWLEADEHHFIHWGDAGYPSLLAQLRDAPVGLYVRGKREALSLPQLAVVGSRNPTPPGRDTAQEFAAHLAGRGLTITSGLALGIDTASHQGALAGAGSTIAVCGTGLDTVYPASNATLAHDIAASGALVSEFPIGTAPLRHNFPRRNRIIAGLTLGTLVVEAAVRSGSLITARLAAEQGREVFAIPGSIHNPLARGCHQLIRQGAKLVETAQDILMELGPLAGALRSAASVSKPADVSGNSTTPLDKEYEILLDGLGFAPSGMDLLVQRTGFKADVVASMLLILELDGRIESYPGGLYVRTRPKAVK
jgi:DNA processing protein